MQREELVSLIDRIKEHRCETQETEVKAAEHGCPQRLYDTLSSFSNQDSGGVIVFGLAEDRGFITTGVYDAQDLQKKVTEQCKQMEPVVRPLYTVALYEGKTVVSAEIPAMDVADRPVFYKGAGRIRGSYIRVGESDEPMSEYEVYSFEAYRKKTNDELRTLEQSELNELNQHETALFLAKLRTKKPNLSALADQKLLALGGIRSDEKLTLAGLLLLGLYPQAMFPQLCITAVVVPGINMGETGAEDERFLDNKKIEGTLPQMVEGAIAFVRRNMKERTIIDQNGRRMDKTEYPLRAIREIILNAVIHRDYSIHTENSPVRVLMYRDRIEVENPGGLYGRITLGNLGKIGADTRNPYIASNLEVMMDTENRFSGIPIVRNEMEKAGLAPPVFENARAVFRVTLYNGIAIGDSGVGNGDRYGDSHLDDIGSGNGYGDRLPERLLTFCGTPRTRAELEQFTGFSRYYTMSKIVQPLIDVGVLRMTIPDKPKSVKQRYVKA